MSSCQFCGTEHGAEAPAGLQTWPFGVEVLLQNGWRAKLLCWPTKEWWDVHGQDPLPGVRKKGAVHLALSSSCIKERVYKILWVSQHEMLEKQKAALRRKYGESVDIPPGVSSFESALDIKRRFEEGKYDDLVVVAPYAVLDHLCRVGLRPWYADCPQVGSKAEADFSYRGRHYKFVAFRRLRGVILDFVPGEGIPADE